MGKLTVSIQVKEKDGLRPELYFMVFLLNHKYYHVYAAAFTLEDAIIKANSVIGSTAVKENLWFYQTVNLEQIQYQFKRVK